MRAPPQAPPQRSNAAPGSRGEASFQFRHPSFPRAGSRIVPNQGLGLGDDRRDRLREIERFAIGLAYVPWRGGVELDPVVLRVAEIDAPRVSVVARSDLLRLLCNQHGEEALEVLQVLHPEGELIDRRRNAVRPARGHHDLVMLLGVAAQECDASAQVVVPGIGDYQAQHAAVECDHRLEVADEQADVRKLGVGNGVHHCALFAYFPVSCCVRPCKPFCSCSRRVSRPQVRLSSSRTFTCRRPSPSTSSSILSPSWNAERPRWLVPVASTSPGLSVWIALTHSMQRGILCAMSPVLKSCLSTPFTQSRICR